MNSTQTKLKQKVTETIRILLPGKANLILHAFPSVHHKYPHIPVIRAEINGTIAAYGQFTTTGKKVTKICYNHSSENIFDTIRQEIERMLDQHPEMKPQIIQLKTSKGPPGRNIAKNEQNFLVKAGREQGVFDIYGKFFPLAENEWKPVAV